MGRAVRYYQSKDITDQWTAHQFLSLFLSLLSLPVSPSRSNLSEMCEPVSASANIAVNKKILLCVCVCMCICVCVCVSMVRCDGWLWRVKKSVR